MKARYVLCALALMSLWALEGQIGGDYSYQFLQLSPSARATALGSAVPAVRDHDLAMAYYQPAMLDEETHQAISFNHSFYLSDISHGLFSYGHRVKSAEINLQAGIQYINYGQFEGFDAIGQATTSFDAAEYAIFVGASRKIYDKLSAGANLKLILSSLGNVNSTAVAADLSFLYYDEEPGLGLSLLVRNVGVQLSVYDEVDEELPLDIQLSLTKRLKYLPFRLGVVVHSLNRWDLSFDDPRLDEAGSLFGEEESTGELNFFNNLSRHFVFSGEFLLGPKDNFNLRFAYSNQRRAELQVASFRSLSGFSFGIGFRANRFKIDYGMGAYHVAGAAHHLSFSTNINKFKKDREL